MRFIYFFGRFHVLVLHLPIALLLTVVAAEGLARREKYRHLNAALPLLWASAALTSILTVALGYMHFSEGGFTGPSALAHRFFGTSVAVVASAAWALRSFGGSLFRRVHLAIGGMLVILVTLTGHFGGNLTHGDTYLVEYAPEPLRRLAGLEAARPPITNVAMADPYLDVVRPIFNQRCFSCHNDDKTRGGLNLARYEKVMKGGKDGEVIAPGKPQESDLYRRITLPREDKAAMPADGKTPLTASQVAIIRWWIQSGAPTKTTLAKLKVPADVNGLIAAQLGIGGRYAAFADANEAFAARKPADPKTIAKLEQAGFMARQSTLSSTELVVSPIAPGTHFTDQQMAVVAAVANQIVELNLMRAGLKDPSMASLPQFSELTRLHLENNELSDSAVRQLAGLGKLQYLNLYGNKGITDASVDSLAKLTGLKHLYLWNTAVTAKAAARLKQLRPDLLIDVGAADETATVTAQADTSNASR